VFSEVFSKADEEQRKRTFEICVFTDCDKSDGDVNERDDVRRRRMRRWEARRNVLMKAAQDAADAANTDDPTTCFDGADVATQDGSDYLTSFNAAHGDASPASAMLYEVDTPSHSTSLHAAQNRAASYPSFNATQASTVPYPASSAAAQGGAGAARAQAAFSAQADPFTAAHGIPEDEKMIVDEGKDAEMVETKSFSREVQNSRSNTADGDVDMQ